MTATVLPTTTDSPSVAHDPARLASLALLADRWATLVDPRRLNVLRYGWVASVTLLAVLRLAGGGMLTGTVLAGCALAYAAAVRHDRSRPTATSRWLRRIEISRLNAVLAEPLTETEVPESTDEAVINRSLQQAVDRRRPRAQAAVGPTA
jgi:hypothetical protein